MTFYTQLLTSKRGPLAKIWLAAHWERKLTKVHVFECDLETAISDIISSKMVIGLRTSSHLLIGVARIYSRKAKYLLADCNEALVRIKIAFRPGQTDLPVERLEAAYKSITLIEDFTAFDAHMPEPRDTSNIDVVDLFSLNQSRSEDITLKEDFQNDYLQLMGFGDDSQSHHTGPLSMDFQSLTQGDAFGDEGFELFDFLGNTSNPQPLDENPETSAVNHQQDADRMEVDASTLNEITLLANEKEGFALPPVTMPPNSDKQKVKKKRKLIVDQSKELTNESIKDQLDDWLDLIISLDLAPPTLQLMQWKESGGVKNLFAQPCSTVAAPLIKETLFAKGIFQVKNYGVCDEVEMMRQHEEGQRDMSLFTPGKVSVLESSIDPKQTHNTELMDLDQMSNNQISSIFTEDENRSELTLPELPSEDSMFVHPSGIQIETQSTPIHTRSVLDSQGLHERSLTSTAQKLLNYLKGYGGTAFSLEALCEGGTRLQTATTFFCFLVLKKQKAFQLHQRAPYEDIVASPGPKF